MAKQVIGLGTVANDGTGDPARTAFGKANDNFTENYDAIERLQAKGTDIASATTTDIGAATGDFVHVTGTTTITGLGTITAGRKRIVRFAGILTLTYNATSLILPTGANITTAANDVAVFVSEGSGNWRCIEYTKADGTALILPSLASYVANAGIVATSDSFQTAISKLDGNITNEGIAYQEAGNLLSDNFNRANSASLGANWTQTGTTFSIVSNAMQSSSASGSIIFTNKASYTAIGNSNIENSISTFDVTIGTINATSFGVGYGFETTGTAGQSMQIRFCMETTNSGRIIFYYNGSTSSAFNLTSTTLLGLTAGDVTSIIVKHQKDRIVASWTNNTTGLSITETFFFTFGRTTVIPIMPSSFYYTMYSFGGTHVIDNLTVDSKVILAPKYMVVGDSIVKGYSAGTIEKRSIDILSNNYVGTFVAYASGNLRIQELNATEIAFHRPQKVIVKCGVNNLRAGESAATIVGRISTFLTALNTAASAYGITYTIGTNFFVCTLLPADGANDVTATNTLIRSTFSAGYIEFFYSFWSGTSFTGNSLLMNEDTIHPNSKGYILESDIYANKFGLKLRALRTITNPNITSISNGYTPIGHVTPQTMIDVVDSKSQLRISNTSYPTTDNGMYVGFSTIGYISYGGYHDGTNYIAKVATPSFVSLTSGSVRVLVDSGRAIGSSFTPTEIGRFSNIGLGIFNTSPAYALDVVSSAGQIRFSSVTGDAVSTGYLRGFNGGMAIGTSPFNGTDYIAKATTASFITMNLGQVRFFADQGLSATAPFVPTERMTLDTSGRLGIGQTSPTAFLHIKAGTSSPNTPPQKNTAGVLLTTIEALASEVNASSFYKTTVALNRFAQGGKINGTTTPVSNTSTTETDLYTYTTKANTLVANDESLILDLGGTLNDITATNQLQFYFGGTLIGNTGALTLSVAGGWSARVIVIRSGGTTATAIVTVTTPSASTASYTNTTLLTGLTLSGTNIIKMTGTSGGAGGGTGDITLNAAQLMWWGSSNN